MDDYTSSRFNKSFQKYRSRIKVQVKEQIRLNEEIDIGVDEFQELLDNQHTVGLRITWLCIILCSICICCYQSQERVVYFLSEPVAVNILYEEINSIEFPIAKICSLENDYVRDYWKNNSADGTIASIEAWHCMNPAYKVIETEGLDLAEIWNLDKYPAIIKKLEFKPKLIYKIDNPERTKILPNISLSIEKSVWGACHIIQLEKKLRNRDVYGSIVATVQSPKLCESGAVMITLQAPIDFQYTMILFPGTHLVKHLDFKEYHFLAPKMDLCITTEEFVNCIKKCLYKLYIKRFPCR